MIVISLQGIRNVLIQLIDSVDSIDSEKDENECAIVKDCLGVYSQLTFYVDEAVWEAHNAYFTNGVEVATSNNHEDEHWGSALDVWLFNVGHDGEEDEAIYDGKERNQRKNYCFTVYNAINILVQFFADIDVFVTHFNNNNIYL